MIINLIKKTVKKISKFSRRAKVIGIIVIIAILLIVFFLIRSKETPSYQTAKVQRAIITEIIDESGTVLTTSKTDVYSPSKGIVEELHVKNGDLVGIDQKLFRVKSTATEDEKADSLASLIAAQSALKIAQQSKMAVQVQLEQARKAVIDARIASDTVVNNPNSYSQLEKDSINSTLTSVYWNFNTLERTYIESDTAISSARASLTKANLAYESTKDRTVLSPAIGTVSNLSISLGDAVTASTPTSTLSLLGLSTQSAPPILTIANFTSNSIVVEINETDISNIKSGQKVVIEPDAIKDVKYSGKVIRVDDIGHKKEGVITYNVYIDILDADEKLKSGMTVDVNIITKTVKNALSVPGSAIKPYKGGRAVRFFNTKTKQIDYIPVIIGIKGTEKTQIIQGLKEGQEIITSLTNEQVKRPGLLGM